MNVFQRNDAKIAEWLTMATVIICWTAILSIGGSLLVMIAGGVTNDPAYWTLKNSLRPLSWWSQ